MWALLLGTVHRPGWSLPSNFHRWSQFKAEYADSAALDRRLLFPPFWWRQNRSSSVVVYHHSVVPYQSVIAVFFLEADPAIRHLYCMWRLSQRKRNQTHLFFNFHRKYFGNKVPHSMPVRCTVFYSHVSCMQLGKVLPSWDRWAVNGFIDLRSYTILNEHHLIRPFIMTKVRLFSLLSSAKSVIKSKKVVMLLIQLSIYTK